MSENMKHLRKLAGIAVVMLVIYNLWIYNTSKSIEGLPDPYVAIYQSVIILYWPVYFLQLLIISFYYFWWEGNRSYALNALLTMILVALFGASSCYYGVFYLMAQ
jgi:hypothetical protein